MNVVSRYGGYTPGKYGLPHVGEVIVDYRNRKKYSQETFAIICGVDKQTVVYWEKQEYLADMKRRILLSKLLAIPPALLGLTWRSLVDQDDAITTRYISDSESSVERFKEHAYGLYDDILTFASNRPDRYSPVAAYSFHKHQQELEELLPQIPEIEKDSWTDLLCRYYQHATFVALHGNKNDQALDYINRSIVTASLPDKADPELIGSALYRRARLHIVWENYDLAKQDSESALAQAEHARGSLKGNAYLISAEINALLSGNEEKIQTRCRTLQDQAANLLYQGKGQEEDGTYLWFNLYAVHHERAKTLMRFALFHRNDAELVDQLKNGHVKANEYLKDAQTALDTAVAYTLTHDMHAMQERKLDYSLTQAKIFLVGKEFEACAREAKVTLQNARAAHSKPGVEQTRKLYAILHELVPENPYVLNLGVEMGIYEL
jgi:DNA-binding XRE family transcriptional regulator